MGSALSVGNTEILQIADAVAREKNIGRHIVLEAMESSIAMAARKKYGFDSSIIADINRKSGEIKIFRELTVVANDYVPPVISEEELELRKINRENQSDNDNDNEDDNESDSNPLKDFIHLEIAQKKDSDINVGDKLREQLPPIDMGRVAAQAAKQVIFQKVRDAEKEKELNDFTPRIGEIISGSVKRIEYKDVIVDLGSAEAVLKRDHSIQGETFRVNDRLRAYLFDVQKQFRGSQIILSRTANEFMISLFKQEVPEIEDGVIEIKSVAREPGSRAKIAVYTTDSNIDPVGSCVGVRGSRVQAVINELQGEKIDIIQWSAEPATFLISALAPAEVAKVVIDEENNRIEVIVPDDQLSIAIGRRGQNVRLASELVGWGVDILSEETESTRRAEEFSRVSSLFVDALNIEEIIAHLLVTEGFSSLEEVAYVEDEELAGIEGFDEEIASELKSRAIDYLENKQNELSKKFDNLNISNDLQEFEYLESQIKIILAENDIKSLDDFADLSTDEFKDIVFDSDMSDAQINDAIMKARAHWFDESDSE